MTPAPGQARTGAQVGGGLVSALSRGRGPVLSSTRPATKAAAIALLGALVVLPLLGLHVPWIMPGTVDVLNAPGNLVVLALGFVFAVVALGFDLLFGYAGLLSFGQALYFATGAYVFDIALSDWQWALAPSLLLALAVCLGLAVVLGAVSLRVGGIAFAMVTLAFAQAGYYVIEMNPHNLTGGDNGLVASTARLPGFLVGVSNTRSLYWVTLGLLALAYLVVRAVTESAAGRVWLAVRENERRVEVLGVKTFSYKLGAFVLSSLLAGLAGIAYVLLVGTASPSSLGSATVTISILVMVILGGLGTRWGAVVGALIYVYLQQELVKVASGPSFASLPAVLRVPLAQPQFLFGAVFILFVLFAPGGIAGILTGLRGRLLRRALGREKGAGLPASSEDVVPSMEAELTSL